MSDEIRNCEFSFKCPKTWDALERTPLQAQRYCGECQQIVHYCKTANELQWAIVRNLCVAVEVREKPPKSTETQDVRDLISIGMVTPEYFVKKDQ